LESIVAWRAGPLDDVETGPEVMFGDRKLVGPVVLPIGVVEKLGKEKEGFDCGV
jgi:hypothetical protein